MYLTLPLPVTNDRFMHVIVYKPDGTRPTRYGAYVSKRGSIKDLKVALSALCGIPPQCLVIGDVYYGKIFTFLEDRVPLTAVRDMDTLFAYV